MLLIILFLAVALGWSPAAGAEELACERYGAPEASCYPIHGRLRVHANLRAYLWPQGSKRLLGVMMNGERVLMPAEVEAALSPEADVYGDYWVCPLEPEKAGVMPMVCIAKASNLRVSAQRSVK